MIIEQLRNLLILTILIVVGVAVNMVWKSNNPIYSGDFKERKQEIDQDYINKNKECFSAYEKQKEYLDNETLSKEFTFDKYKSIYSEPKILKELDLNFSKTAREFRTNIGFQLGDKVDFDGKYTIVGVGMTGWDGPTWIVDRTNGKAYEFPYQHYYFSLDYKKDSNLIIINSKEKIKEMHDEQECFYLNITTKDEEISGAYDLVPHYLLWENNQFKYLGPKEYTPAINYFWESYFKE